MFRSGIHFSQSYNALLLNFALPTTYLTSTVLDFLWPISNQCYLKGHCTYISKSFTIGGQHFNAMKVFLSINTSPFGFHESTTWIPTYLLYKVGTYFSGLEIGPNQFKVWATAFFQPSIEPFWLDSKKTKQIGTEARLCKFFGFF